MVRGRQREGVEEYWQSRRRALEISREMGEIRAWIEHGRYRVSVPDEDGEFKSGAIQLGGTVKMSSGGAWSFPMYARPLVENLIHDSYGRGSIIFGEPPLRVSPVEADRRESYERSHMDERDYYVDLIGRLLATKDYEWARDTLSGIAETVQRLGMITARQKAAVEHIMVGRLKHDVK